MLKRIDIRRGRSKHLIPFRPKTANQYLEDENQNETYSGTCIALASFSRNLLIGIPGEMYAGSPVDVTGPGRVNGAVTRAFVMADLNVVR